MKLLDELQERVVCGDGAMGTLLLDQGLPMESCLEEVCVSDPDRVRAIHRDYIAAGARVIETNDVKPGRATICLPPLPEIKMC
jgi:methionine synthase I (cobalamin-dependent)